MMQEDRTHFSKGAFLKDNLLFVAFVVLLLVFFTIVLTVLSVSPSGIIFIDAVVLLGSIGYLSISYARQVSFWRDMEDAASTLDKGAHLGDLLEDPTTLQGRIACDALQAVTEADNHEITDLKMRVRENSEYTELWVHEAKTPLAAAKLVTKRMAGPDALALRRELERMDDLIGQALFAARTESLVQDYLIRELDLAEVAKETCKSHMHFLTSLKVSLDFHIDPALTVFADKMWLEFIIAQVVINAAKYGAQTIRFEAFVTDHESSSSCTVLEIKDDGCGIPAADVPRVFDRGFTGEVGRAHGSATGMGLYLVARMCASMGLSIMLASEEGVGTRVRISFPHDRRRMALEARDLSGMMHDLRPTYRA